MWPRIKIALVVFSLLLFQLAVIGQSQLPDHLNFLSCKNTECVSETIALWNLVESGHAKKAIKKLHQRILSDGTDVNSLLLLGFMYQHKGDLSNAIQTYKAAIREDSQNATAHFMKGNAELKGERYMAALGSYEQAVRLDPLFYEAHNNMALIRLRNQGQSGIIDNDYILARRDLDRVMTSATDGDDRVFFNLGMVHANIRKYDDARQYFSRAISTCEDNGKSYFYRGLCNFYLREYEAAISDIIASRVLRYQDPRSEEVENLLENIVAFMKKN